MTIDGFMISKLNHVYPLKLTKVWDPPAPEAVLANLSTNMCACVCKPCNHPLKHLAMYKF